MKIPLFGAALGVLGVVTSVFAGPRDAQWGKVENAVHAGLPRSAIEALEPIIASALADEMYPEAIKAIARKITLETSIQGHRAEEKIVRLEAEVAKAPAEIKAVMEALLAHWYWDYFQQNRWRFQQRTQTAGPGGADLRTWDLARILAEIDRHFTAALADEKRLQATAVSVYDELLPRGNVPDAYRPTLFDFVAYHALQFYQAGEQGVTRAENAFELDAVKSPIFAEATEFLAWTPRVADEASPIAKAVRLLQKIMVFHRDDADRSAFLDADLARLRFGHNKAVGDEDAERYKAALRRFAEAAADHESSARALAALAALLDEQGEPAKARELARRGLEGFPDEAGGALCFNLIQKIERQEATIETERVWTAPWPMLDVTYRNVTKVHFRAVRMDFEKLLADARWGLGRLSGDDRYLVLAREAELAWSAELPATSDYRARTERLAAPTTLKPGYYFIFASHDETFSGAEGPVSMVDVWVSSLALVTNRRADGGAQGGFVLDARTGEPIASAGVRAWRRDRDGYFKAAETTYTDADGRFEIMSDEAGVMLLAEHRGQAVATNQPSQFFQRGKEGGRGTHTIFFTDRALYRPGQAIHYKGICFRRDDRKGDYATLGRRQVMVVFNDANGKEIARAQHGTNDYGSFSGVFMAPRDRLMGQMSLVALEPGGTTVLTVEEYKRPKFRVELGAPGEAPKLDAPVTLTGRASAYTGAAIGGASVKWRVERSAQLPSWCWWWQPPAATAVAHGAAVTEADGGFTIRFTAAPDRSVPAANEPVFTYTVHVDVTDTNGETRSDERVVRAGYTALQASLAAEEWQTPRRPVQLTLETKTLEGEPQAAGGIVIVHALRQPAAVQREAFSRGPAAKTETGGAKPEVNDADPETWELGAEVARRPFASGPDGTARLDVRLKAGIYRASVETQDRFGKNVTARKTVRVIDPSERWFGLRVPNCFTAERWSLEPGETFTAWWGTGYEEGRAFVEIECNGEALQSYWTEAGRTQALIEQEVTEEMRGGFTVRVTYVRENRAYINERVVEVPWSNKQLAIKWETFRSKLTPGQKETWTAVVTGPKAKRAAAEMVAGLYDAALDQFAPHQWHRRFPMFRREHRRQASGLHNFPVSFHVLYDGRSRPQDRPTSRTYRSFPFNLVGNAHGWSEIIGTAHDGVIQLSAFTVQSERAGASGAMMSLSGSRHATYSSHDMAGAGSRAEPTELEEEPPALPDLGKVAARAHLNETAFFFPHLVAKRNGEVRLTFTMPEALTRWRFFGFAHDRQLRAGFLQDTVVTAKDLMVQPNPPRFVREGDAIEFTVKVSNQTDRPQAGKVRLTFADAATLRAVDAVLGNRELDRDFDVPAKESRSYSWRIAVPDGIGFLTYKAVGTTRELSDGEEGFLPVLSRRILITESLPLPMRGRGTREFEFTKLLDAEKSGTLRHQALTVQMVSQPAWHAVLALPYLMEFPHACSEQIFSRLYANALARHIAGSDPKIRRIFDLWKSTAAPALDSPLTLNAELKAVMLEETPWLRHARSESEARKNLGLLFDANRLDEETARAAMALAERQLSDGMWPWFPGGPLSEYISLYITTGFARLRHLGAAVEMTAALKALPGLEAGMRVRYERIVNRESYVPGPMDALYLYGRSFFLGDRPLAPRHKEVVDYLLTQSRKFWLQAGGRQSQAHLALALQRFGDKATAQAILASIKERSVTDAELGMFWRDDELGWWWHRARIETQALMIEAFAEVTGDEQAVEDCKVWLLKEKQAQDWKTTKATADAVYALLLRGGKLLGSDARVSVSLGGAAAIEPERTEAGTGFYERRFAAAEIEPAMGRITATKPDDGVSWGSVHWQYLEEVSKVTAHAATPLTITKSLFVKENSANGRVLRPVTEARAGAAMVAVGDELVVRLELRTDRDMEYVHVKDQRGSGTEPVNVISGYKHRDGLSYYESTRDTATHLFIDYLPKGVYVFEYSTRVQLKGRYQSGVAEIQCMYAPEFNGHSESVAIEVR